MRATRDGNCLFGEWPSLFLSAWKRLEEGYLCYRAGSLHLANLAVSLGQPRWHVRPKSHYLEHAVYDFERKNLRYMSNYPG